MSGNRILLLLLLSLGGVIVLWSNGGMSERLLEHYSLRTPSSGVVNLAESSLNWERSIVQSSSRSKAAPENSNESQKRSLRRTENENVEENGGGVKQMLPASYLLNQIWYSNPITDELRDGINKGLFNVGKFLIVWIVFMCTIGGVMRCYLCCNTMWTDSNYNLRSLYDSFADREPMPAFDNESEGIALDSLRSRDIESHEPAFDNESEGIALDSSRSRDIESNDD